jgi:flagella basal body P-ring formation protein FlgA
MISEADIQLEKVDVSQLRGQPMLAIEDVIGSKAKNSLSAGSILNDTSICAVCKGDSVSITVDNPSISIVMSGVALTDGAVGERIRVQNSSSKRIVEAIIVNDDTVKVSI